MVQRPSIMYTPALSSWKRNSQFKPADRLGKVADGPGSRKGHKLKPTLQGDSIYPFYAGNMLGLSTGTSPRIIALHYTRRRLVRVCRSAGCRAGVLHEPGYDTRDAWMPGVTGARA